MKNNKPFIYIAGPYRSKIINDIIDNIAAARRIAVKCWQLGYPTFCPHLNTACMDGAAIDDIFLLGDLAILEALAKSNRGCIMILIEGWEKSDGTLKEIKKARQIGMQIYNSFENFIITIS